MKVSNKIIVAMGLNLGVTADQIEAAGIDYGLVDTDDYNPDTDYFKVNAAAASILATYLMLKSESQGQFSVSFDTDQIANRVIWLANHSGGLFPIPPELIKLDRTVRAVNRW